MKCQCIFFLYVLLSNAGLFAQDTLLLNIPERRGGIILKFNNRILPEDRSTINPKATGWTFKTVSKLKGHRLSIINTEGNDSLSIEDLNHEYEIINNSFTDPALFTLKSNLNLKIYNQAGKLIKTYQVAFKPAALSNPTVNTTNSREASSAFAYRTGSAVIDALTLADPIQPPALKLQILSYYANNESDVRRLSEVYKSNKFLDSIAGLVATTRMQQNTGKLLTGFSAVGGLDVTNITDALARFLVKRTKQELSTAFFARFKSTLDSIQDLQTLFPGTSSLLQAIDNEIYNFERYIQQLRETFILDISHLHRNLPGIVHNHPAFFNRHPLLSASLISACFVAVELENQTHPGDIIAGYPLALLDNKPTLQPHKGVIQLLQLMSQSFRDTATGEQAAYWVNISKTRELANNRLALKCFLGLLWQQAAYKFDSIRFGQTRTLIQALSAVADAYDSSAAAYDAYKTFILMFGSKTNALNSMIIQYRDVARDSSALQKYQQYFRASVDLLEYATAISELPELRDITAVRTVVHKMKPYFQISYATVDMLIDIQRRNFPSAVNHAVYIYNEIKVKAAEEEVAAGLYPTPETDTSVSNGRWWSFLKVRKSKKPTHAFSNSLSMLVKYGGFMSVIASAKSSAEIEQAIEVFALPTGSSRVKRSASFNVSFNAYVGLFAGYEKIKGVDKNFRVNTYGVTAPLGVAISKGHAGASSSLFMSIVDIGAVTAFRFGDDVTEKVPHIQLSDIISPGIFYSFGIPKTPLSANVGYQAGPLLRKVNLNQNLYEQKYSRFSISVCVDIPVLNFYTKTD